MWGAQQIISKIEHKRQLLEEIRNTRAALALAEDVVTAYLNMKEQKIQGLVSGYRKKLAAFLHLRKAQMRRQRPDPADIHITADFEFFTPFYVPLDLLKNLIFEKISVTGRALRLWAVLSRVDQDLKNIFLTRNQFIANHRRAASQNSEYLIRIYFGQKDQNGDRDRVYPHLIKAIGLHSDSAIYFAMLLCDDLFKHYKFLATQLGKDAPAAKKPDWSKAYALGLIPDNKGFEDWIDESLWT